MSISGPWMNTRGPWISISDASIRAQVPDDLDLLQIFSNVSLHTKEVAADTVTVNWTVWLSMRFLVKS